MAKKIEKPYYEKYKTILFRKLKAVKDLIYPEIEDIFLDIPAEAKSLRDMESGITIHPLRYYQKEALYTLHHIYQQSVNVSKSPVDIQKEMLKMTDYKHIKPLIDTIDIESGTTAPYIGFEMATGSGKTMLMGASVYYLNKHRNIKNFLIITPSSTEIYKKTIRNFQKGSNETVWSVDVPFTFDLITGDNFKDTKDLYHSDTDANIFIFNIDKFGSNAVRTKKQWEGSIWKDENGNTISLLDYLSSNELVIITDEAHHAQSPKARKIIGEFKPVAILEYTATAVETERNSEKKNQTIVYKYDIKRFLDDGYGKKVRVLAIPGEEKKKGKTAELSDTEKYKIQTFFLVHLVKKKALTQDVSCRNLKAIGFVKVKNEILFAEKVEKYIKEALHTDTQSLEVILEKAKIEDTETTNLILELFEKDYKRDIALLQSDIEKIASTSILLHNKSDKLVKKKFDTIKTNEVEIVIFIDMLNEGIDMPNIYSMVVINDTPSDFKTSVKQIVGRGVRLNKETRDYDDVDDNPLLTHSEKLHIVCDKGASFEEVVLAIQNEFGLNDKTFSIETSEEEVIDNKIKPEKLKGLQIPRIKVDFKRKKGITIQDVMTDFDRIIEDYLSHNCFNRESEGLLSKFLKYGPESFFIEIDLFADEKTFHNMGEEQGWNYEKLHINEIDIKEIYGRVVAKLKPIPDVPKTFQIFHNYAKLLNEKEIYFYCLDEVDYKLSKNHFKTSFVHFYINYVEKEYFELDLTTLDSESNTWSLPAQFKDTRIKIPVNDKENNYRENDEQEVKDLIRHGRYFYGYENSVYDYDKFDSFPEKKLADYVNHIIEKKPPDDKKEPFWLRNDRNVYFEYGTHKYYPDFLFFYNRLIYVIEIKGEAFSNPKKNALLIELKKSEGIGKVEGYDGIVVFEIQMKRMKDFSQTFDEFVRDAERIFKTIQSKSITVSEAEVSDDQKFTQFVPAYEPSKAYSKYIQMKNVDAKNWFEVNENINKHPETTFASLIKSDDLGIELQNKWVLFNSEFKSDELDGKIVLCKYPGIEDTAYKRGFTIRRIQISIEEVKMGLFTNQEKKISLVADKDDEEPYVIANPENLEVIGVYIN